jgi:hypothetical protein
LPPAAPELSVPRAVELADPMPLDDFDPAAYRALDAAPDESFAAVDTPVDTAPEPVACRFVTSDFSGPLHLTADSDAFAVVDAGAEATVSIPKGDAAQGAHVSLKLAGLALQARVLAPELELYLRRPQLFQGYLWAMAGARVEYLRAAAKRITYAPPRDRRLQVTGTLSAELPCEAFTLDATDVEEFDAERVVGGRHSVLETQWLGSAAVPLSISPRGPVVALLDTRTGEDASEPDAVAVLETRGNMSRVAYWLDAVVVVGWVPSSALASTREPSEWGALNLITPWGPTEPLGASDPTRALAAPELGPEAKPRCVWNAALSAEIGGIRRQIGTLASAIPILVHERRQGFRAIKLLHPALSASEGTTLWVSERSIYPCELRQ